MTKAVPFTEATIKRAVAAARKAGVEVNAVRVEPDGTVTVFQQGGIVLPSPSDENSATSKWLDVEA
jgi:uncharacterized protein GlcG (DUF336 family)